MEKNQSNFNGFSLGLGLFVGGAAGILAGLMVAPKSGRELRSDIREKSCQIYGDTKQAISDAQMRAKSIIDEAKHRADELKREAAQTLSEARIKACEALNCSVKERVPFHTAEYAEEAGGEA